MRWPWTPYGRTELISWGATTFGITLATLYFYPWLAFVPALGCLFFLNFFRDPERPIPAEPGLIISPADGKVTDVQEMPEDEYLGGPAVRVGIFLSVFDVHVNRVPCAGVVEHLRHREGKYLDARDPNCATENERQDLGLLAEGPDGRPMKVLVRQVAGLIARRIVCPVPIGKHLERGERYGMIKFGSRTEVYLPIEVGFEPAVSVGDRVQGGRTILGRLSGVASSGLPQSTPSTEDAAVSTQPIPIEKEERAASLVPAPEPPLDRGDEASELAPDVVETTTEVEAEAPGESEVPAPSTDVPPRVSSEASEPAVATEVAASECEAEAHETSRESVAPVVESSPSAESEDQVTSPVEERSATVSESTSTEGGEEPTPAVGDPASPPSDRRRKPSRKNRRKKNRAKGGASATPPGSKPPTPASSTPSDGPLEHDDEDEPSPDPSTSPSGNSST